KKRKEDELKKASSQSIEEKRSSSASASAAPKDDEESMRETDIHVITRAVYRSNDEGYLDPERPEHIWVIQRPRSAGDKVEPGQLTRGRFAENEPVWSNDSSTIYFISLHVDEPYYQLPQTELYSVAVKGG